MSDLKKKQKQLLYLALGTARLVLQVLVGLTADELCSPNHHLHILRQIQTDAKTWLHEVTTVTTTCKLDRVSNKHVSLCVVTAPPSCPAASVCSLTALL